MWVSDSNNRSGSSPPPTAMSWEECFKQEHAGSPEHMAFLHANTWQRDSISMRMGGYDGFHVLVGLFLVLLLEALFSFDPSGFESVWASNAFLATIVCGTACGVFTMVSTAMIKGKIQRLMIRDHATVNVQQRGQQGRTARLDRLVHNWEAEAHDRQFQPASISYEWYNGARLKSSKWVPRTPVHPRALKMYGFLSFVAMIASVEVAVAIRIADSKGVVWSLFFVMVVGAAATLPVIFVLLSAREPTGSSDEGSNPFEGFFV